MDNQGPEGHGHVKPRKDGQIMRCGGPGFCTACSVEASHELTRLRAELAEARRHAKVLYGQVPADTRRIAENGSPVHQAIEYAKGIP